MPAVAPLTSLPTSTLSYHRTAIDRNLKSNKSQACDLVRKVKKVRSIKLLSLRRLAEPFYLAFFLVVFLAIYAMNLLFPSPDVHVEGRKDGNSLHA
jgi:hypothetical protein